MTWLKRYSGLIVWLSILVGVFGFYSIPILRAPLLSISLLGAYWFHDVAVPPEPNPFVNNSTLAGVDSNNNGVRDDVERVLAHKFGGTSDYSYAMAYARAYQEEIVTPTPATRDQALVLAGNEVCSVTGASEALYHFTMSDVMENTPARKQAMRALNDLINGYLGSELPPCSQ